MAYAVIRTGGKQYRVSQGDRLRVEKIEAEVGSQLELGDVLAFGAGGDIKLEAGELAGQAVKATVVRHGRGRKIRLWKFKRRKAYNCRQGHRQGFTELLITAVPGASFAEASPAESPAEASEPENTKPDQE